MVIAAGEQQSGGEVRDGDGRLIVVGPGGVAIGGGGGGSGDPLSDGTPGGALPAKTLWIAGANGAVLQGLVADATGRLRTVVEGTPAVSVSNFPASQPVTGPLTDTQLRASAVPVSGSFFQATQPVSGTVTANAGTGPWPVTDNGGSITVDAPAGTPVRVDPTGTTTQPVSISSAPQIAVNNVETIADNAGFTDGTSKLFPQGYVFDETAGTALTENDIAAARVNANRAVATVTEDGATRGRYATVKAASTAAASTDTGQVVHLHPLSSTPFHLVPANRTTFSLTALALTPVTSEALQSMIATRALTAAGAATSQTVTAGKTLRITAINISMVTTAAAVLQGFVALRAVTSAGTLAITSPLLWASRISAPAAVASTGMAVPSQFPDGIDLPAGAKFGFSIAFSATTGVVDIALEGYEF